MSKKRSSRKSETDLARLREMTDKDIDFSEIPEVTPEMFARGIVRRGLKPVVRKKQLTLRMDSDVIEWFKRQGRGYQTKINSLLRAYMEEHRRKTAYLNQSNGRKILPRKNRREVAAALDGSERVRSARG